MFLDLKKRAEIFLTSLFKISDKTLSKEFNLLISGSVSSPHLNSNILPMLLNKQLLAIKLFTGWLFKTMCYVSGQLSPFHSRKYQMALMGFYSVEHQTILLVKGEPLGSERVKRLLEHLLPETCCSKRQKGRWISFHEYRGPTPFCL